MKNGKIHCLAYDWFKCSKLNLSFHKWILQIGNGNEKISSSELFRICQHFNISMCSILRRALFLLSSSVEPPRKCIAIYLLSPYQTKYGVHRNQMWFGCLENCVAALLYQLFAFIMVHIGVKWNSLFGRIPHRECVIPPQCLQLYKSSALFSVTAFHFSHLYIVCVHRVFCRTQHIALSSMPIIVLFYLNACISMCSTRNLHWIFMKYSYIWHELSCCGYSEEAIMLQIFVVALAVSTFHLKLRFCDIAV